MKILYVSTDRHAGELAAFALRGVAWDVAVGWTGSLSDARGWTDEHRDVAVLIVEVDSDPQDCESFIRQVREAGVTAPVVVAARDPESVPATLRAAAAEIVPKDQSFLSNLPAIVNGALKSQAIRPAAPVGEPTARRQSIEPPADSGALPFAQAVSAREALEQRLSDALAAIERARQDRAVVRTDLERHLAYADVGQREADAGVTSAVRADAAEAQTQNAELVALEQKLADTVLALERAEHRHAVEMSDAAARLAEQRKHADERSTHAAVALDALQTRLVNEAEALQQAEQQAAADRQAAAEEAARRRAAIEAELIRETANRQVLEKALAAAEAARIETAEEHAAALAAVGPRLAASEQGRAVLEARLADEVAKRLALADQLVAAEAVLHRADDHHALEMRNAAATLQHAEQQAATDRYLAAEQAAAAQVTFDTALTQDAVVRETLAKQLAAAEADRQRADASHTSAMARLADYQAEAEARFARAAAELAEQVAGRLALERSLREKDEARQLADEQHALDMSHAAARLDEHRAHADERLSHASKALDVLQAKLIDAAGTLQQAEQRAATDRHLAAEQAAAAQTTFDTAMAQEVALREALAKQLAAAEADRQRADNERTSAMTRLTDYRAEAEARFARDAVALAEQAAGRLALQQHLREKDEARQLAEERLSQTSKTIDELHAKLIDAAGALQHAEHQAATDRQAAAEQATIAQTRFDAALTQEAAVRQALANQLAATESDRQRTDDEHRSVMAAMMARLTDSQAEAETRFAHDAGTLEALRSDLARATAELTQQAAHREALERDLYEKEAARAALARQLAERESKLETELGQHVAQREALARDLSDTRAAADEAQRRFLEGIAAMRDRAREHELRLEERATRERAEWEATLADRHARLAERDAELQSQRSRQVASDETAAKAMADAEERLRLTLEARNRDGRTIEELHDQIQTLRRELEATNGQREMLRAEVELIPELRKQIDYLHTEHRRRFDDTPVSMCRCRPDGTLTEVTQALARLLGYSNSEELHAVDFGAKVFDSADELRWLIDRCLTSRSVESIETTWAKKDGTRILVRLVAVATTADGIDLAAQDVTAIRALEERLRHSQRLEAVARYASEVAVTCENVLSDVKQDGQQWLNRIESEAARQHGKRLLDEVTRASGFLRKLAVYGDTEKNLATLVEVHHVLRGLKSVLEHVAGDNIELVLPKGSKPLHLDVEAARVERILVNVAAYARERMPFGGRLMIGVTTEVLDRTFTETYPNVRPGAHVLLTVTEVKGAARADWSAAFLDQTPRAQTGASESITPGVDLGVLQGLVGDCGGHVWIAAEPSGDMVLKIHLPRRLLDDQETASQPGRWINRLASVRQ